MFELEDYSSGFHEGYLNKYAESSGPTLDFYITDSLQDMLDMDIRSEIATVVGGSNELASLVSDLPSSFDHAIDAISAINNSASTSSSCSSNNSYLHSSAWLGATSGSTWSSSNDFYADVGACVNPISVMPMISSSLLHRSPKTNLNVNGLSSATSPPPPSPTENKSHLTFSPAHIKQSTNAMRNEQLSATTSLSSASSSSIPKQIVAISSTVTSATTAPATMATNSALQRKNTAIDAIKKDLSTEILKAGSNHPKTGSIIQSNGLISATNTIKLAPGIGGLTFANSITYNKLKQQSAIKSANGTPLTSNGTIVLKRDRDSSPLHHMTTLNLPNGAGGNGGSIVNGFHNGQHVTKLLGRNVVQTSAGFTPKSIASAQSPLLQNGSGSGSNFSIGSPSSSSNSSSNFGAGRLTPIGANGRLTPINSNGRLTPITNVTGRLTPIPVKPLPPKPNKGPHDREFPKPAYSYSCLIAMALKNSRGGSLPVSEIYSFMCEHFPYFKTAPSGWKNSVRHNLSLNKCFEKIEKPATNGNQRKGCLWAMNPERITKMDEEVQKWSRKDPLAIRKAMVYPEHLEALERGEMKHGSTSDSDLELDSQSEIEETSDSDQDQELVDDTIVESMFVEEDIEEIEEEMGMMGGGSSQHHMMVVNGNDVVGVATDEDVCDVGLAQQHRDFDIEVSLETHTIEKNVLYDEKVEDIYDAIDMEDDKEAVRMAISQSDIIEMGTADIINAQNANATNNNSSSTTTSGYQSPKRARLNVNYSIRPAAELVEKSHSQSTTTTTTIPVQATYKQIKVHNAQQQHILVQTCTKRANSPHPTQQQQQQQNQQHQLQQFQHFTAIPNHNRRKMQLVNRIA